MKMQTMLLDPILQIDCLATQTSIGSIQQRRIIAGTFTYNLRYKQIVRVSFLRMLCINVKLSRRLLFLISTSHLRPAIRCKRPRLLLDNLAIVLHDSAHCHFAHNVTNIMRRWHWEVSEHPPYSPDISPCGFDLFPKLKEPVPRHAI